MNINIFRKARYQLGYTQKAIALETGVSTRTVCGWEQGTQFPRPEALRRLSKLTGIPEETFIEKAWRRK